MAAAPRALGAQSTTQFLRRRRAILNLKLGGETIVKNLLKLLAISLLAAFVLLASIQPQPTRAATTAAPAVTCGARVFGHTVSGDICGDDGKPIFVHGSHITSQGTDVCPICGAPTTSGHSQSGG